MITLAQMRLTDLILDPRCQMRVVMDERYVQRLADHLDAGGVVPPVIAYRTGQRGPALLADGWHRLRAHELTRRPRRKTIEVDVRQGTLRDATLFATEANKANARQMEDADFRKAIFTLLEDPEWGKWSARSIADHVGVSHTTVNRIKEWLKEQRAAGTSFQMGGDSVQATRNGTTYTIHFRGMTPTRQQDAVEAETESHWPTWEREGKEGLENAERCFANRGAPFGPVLYHVQEALAALRPLEKALADERRAAKEAAAARA